MKTLINDVLTLDWDQLLTSLGAKTAYTLLILLLSWLARRLAHFLVKWLSSKTPPFTAQDLARQQTLVKLFLSLSDHTIFFLTGYGILAVIGVPVSSLIAGAGIAGLAIGLGAQGFLTDLINGAFILIERQYDVGDQVVIQNIAGKVTNLGIRTTQLKSSDGTIHIIPNRHITYVSNYSRGNRRVQIDLPLPFDTNFDHVNSLLTEVGNQAAADHPHVLDSPTYLGARKALDQSTIYRVELLVENGKQESVYYTFYQLFQKTLQEAGITAKR
ncbi:mechanosensitive ion channel family protein [Streptococcus sp. E24BD]|uniref:mechanosensitive ion channel family protein n=1 Tax=Streptococcus sp. E24BD TaxID=3278715 RepID=UPI00359DF72C